MEITINIKVPAELVNALENLASAFIVSGSTHLAAVVSNVAAPTQADKPKRPQRTKQEGPEQPTHQDSEETPQAAVPSVVDLRAKAQTVGTTPDAKKAIKALLVKFGSKSISDIPEERRADFLAKLDDLE